MLDQQRALTAYQHVTLVKKKPEVFQKSYGSQALSLPALIRHAGLSQALHFVNARQDSKRDAAQQLLQHLGQHLLGPAPGNENRPDALCSTVREAGMVEYLQLTREALAVLQWYGRFAQSELKVDRTDDDTRRED